jgi:hypothetical protein
MGRWMLLAPLLVLPQDEPPRLRVWLDQRTPPAVARASLQAAADSGLPFEAVVVVRDFAALDRDLLAWRPADLSRVRLADREDLDGLARCARRLPSFVISRGAGARHRAHGIPRDLREMDACTRR